ncbi:thioredoxin-like protein AAED1, chloroplastic [Triticum dicoccoides]|uniref:Thioredoxin-like protein AAED1, chloroplastic n=2 Tax=Triticum TaxID=4564 RepID=A0A9R0S7E2_TRITD|nr:thioredoxin-like protein AAED1, chloroplastic [Triticum dicoccoides]XP_044363120.1 thioredoxin-like protein AAED1, chloroplastic [Triticum aestivum]VAH89669.1 unnamed protein product [Triticum turgidum subsp. durum]
MPAHALLTVPHATAGPRLAAPLFTPAATGPSLCRANCRPGSLTNQQQRLRHLHPAAAATKPGAIGSAAEAAAAPAEGLVRSLQGVEVFDLNGKALPVADLWKDRKAVVAFARHFGCVLCRKRADLLAAKQEAMEAAGVSPVLIGPGTVEQAKAFSDQTKFKGEVYADPDYSSYKALEFANGLFSTFTPSAGLKIIQLYREGYRQDWELSFEKNTRTKGGWYQGGLLVAGPGIDNISYIHKDKEAGDDPEMEDVLTACCS